MTHLMRRHAVAVPISGRIDIEVPPGIAAAVPFRPSHWWTAAATHVVGLGTGVVGLVMDVVDLTKDRLLSEYPPRLDFLDSSRTAREMYRL